MLQIIPCSITDAKVFIERFHSHRKPPISGLFALACAADTDICGVAIVGRPVARHLDDSWTAEVTRVATDGTKNACSMLYAACWRAARALGYVRLISYTLASESGKCLQAAGWRIVGEVHGRSWHCKSRPRVDLYPLQNKIRWEATHA